VDSFNREESGAIILGFLGIFIGVGFIVLGMLPVATYLAVVLLALGMPVAVVLMMRRWWLHHAMR